MDRRIRVALTVPKETPEARAWRLADQKAGEAVQHEMAERWPAPTAEDAHEMIRWSEARRAELRAGFLA